MIKFNELEDKKIIDLEKKYPFINSFFENNNLDISFYKDYSLKEYLNHFTQDDIEQLAIDIENIRKDLISYINQMIEFLGLDDNVVESITIVAGKDKLGNKENYDELVIRKSEIVSIVGPTGSGKSRLLADIEWTADEDTPTGRKILINGKIPDKKSRFSISNKLVAQLSQNMNFVMDLSVKEFLELHAQCRMVVNQNEIIDKIIEAANKLSGEKFNINTPITSLSGGQSRALMIADTAILSTSPIVLIDEIENAGIDRKKAINLLVSENKIVLMATHDPSLALMADKRIVIKNGGIYKVVETSYKEKKVLVKLDEMNKYINFMRKKLRSGETI